VVTLSYIVADSELRQNEFTFDVCVVCSAADCLEMLDNAQKSFEEEHKISQVVRVLVCITFVTFITRWMKT